MQILLVVCGIAAAALVGVLGLMVYASPNPNDQLIGKVVIASALGILVLTAFHRNAYAAAALWLVTASVVLGACWLLWKWSGH